MIDVHRISHWPVSRLRAPAWRRSSTLIGLVPWPCMEAWQFKSSEMICCGKPSPVAKAELC